MQNQTNQEMFHTLTQARHEISYNYTLDLNLDPRHNTPLTTGPKAPYFEYWKMSDVLKTFATQDGKLPQINWRNITSVILDQTPQKYIDKMTNKYEWVKKHLQNHYQINNDKPIEISRYAGWAISNYLQDSQDTSFQKAYFLYPGQSFTELLKSADIISLINMRKKLSKTTSRVNGIIKTLCERNGLLNQSTISREFYKTIYNNIFLSNKIPEEYTNKRPLLDYMDYKLLDTINQNLNKFIMIWNNLDYSLQTANTFYAQIQNTTSNIRDTMNGASFYHIKKESTHNLMLEFDKQEHSFIKQYASEKKR